jgi:hypothetical protein
MITRHQNLTSFVRGLVQPPGGKKKTAGDR